jgi:GMP synthase-like glutamine amidotransferase
MCYEKDMSTLIIKNTRSHSSGSLEAYLEENNIDHTIVYAAQGEAIPPTDNYDNIVLMGGPMSANQTEKYPFINKEIQIVQQYAGKEKKILGLCLGSQIIAKALGAEIYQGKEKEVGWYDIALLPPAYQHSKIKKLIKNPDTKEINRNIKVFHWHNDGFTLPPGCELCGTSSIYKNQFFSFGPNIIAMQFHLEITLEMIEEWMQQSSRDPQTIMNDSKKYLELNIKRARRFYQSFFIS